VRRNRTKREVVHTWNEPVVLCPFYPVCRFPPYVLLRTLTLNVSVDVAAYHSCRDSAVELKHRDSTPCQAF
jgi:hypothetical protein